MAEKITCPKCGEEFDLGEGYKKHLEALEKKAVKDADKRNKEDYEKKLEQGRKKDKEISEAKVKAEKEKTDKIQQELLAEKARRKEIDKQYKDHYANLSAAKIKSKEEDLEQKSAEKDKKHKLETDRLIKALADATKKATQGLTVDQGSMQEMQLGEFLQKVFKSTEDKITPYGKGVPGADWLQEVIEKDESICRILYESKNTKGWSNDWLEKLQEDMKDSKANIGIIFSRALPKNFNKNEEFSHTGNIFICKYNYNVLKVLASTQRWLLTQLNKERKNGKTNELSAIKFWDNPKVKNVTNQLINKQSSAKKNIVKSQKNLEEALEDIDSISINFDELFGEIKNIGIDYFSKKKAEEDEK